MSSTIALLSQPNVGKSTLFNGLTGSHQHVGNWPGKTVEKKDGLFTYNNKEYMVVDLPGSYSLSANSDEEVVTREYIANEDCQLVCIMADVTQLERSLFMLADYCGISKPTILVLNMMDVAEKQGKKLDIKKLEKKLGIPVVAMSAAFSNKYQDFYSTIEKVHLDPKQLNENKLRDIFKDSLKDVFIEIEKLLPKDGIKSYSSTWLTTKLIEKDEIVIEMVRKNLNNEKNKKLSFLLSKIKQGNLITGENKFKWINYLLDGVVENKNKKAKYKMNWIDKLMTKKIVGKFVAIISLLTSLILSIAIGMPIMSIGLSFPIMSEKAHEILNSLGAPIWVNSLIADALVAALGYTISMAGLVLGVTFVFGLLEEVGFMARISYAFDNTFSKMGLQGKSIMPLIVSFGCNMGGTYSCRVIDTWGQKTLTVALSWAIPCMGCWGVIGLLTSIFFGGSSYIVIIALFAVIIFHIWLTAKIFRPKLVPKNKQAGMIMELPPYHRPKWGALLRYVFGRFVSVFWKAFKMVSIITIVVWLLSGMGSGEITGTLLYKIGKVFEPITSVFGLKWQMFIAWATSIMGKEATLGVFSALFTSTNGIFVTETFKLGAVGGLSDIIAKTVTKPEALAFIFAFTFNVPCLMTVGSTQTEIHSIKWTLKITFYYLISAIIYAFLAYRIGILIFG